MGRMVRKQVYITQEQDALLKRWAAQLGVTESELIRQGIERICKRTKGTPEDHAALRGEFAFMEDRARTAPLDHAAWEELVAFIEERARTIPPTGEKRRWSREEMYNERFNRLSR